MKILSIDKDKVQVELTRDEILKCFEQLMELREPEYVETEDEAYSVAKEVDDTPIARVIGILKQVANHELDPFDGYHDDLI